MKNRKPQLIHACFAIGLTGLFTSTAILAALPPHYIESISLAAQEGINTNMVVLENVSANKHIDAIQVQPTQSNIDIGINGHVSCEPHNDIGYEKARAHFGPTTVSLYSASYSPTVTDGKGNKRISEAGNALKFSVPLAQIKQGHPAVRFDPLQELNKALQKHLNDGGTKLSFYQQDQLIQVERTVAMMGWCKVKGTNDSQSEDAETSVKLTVKYEGDPDLKLTGTLNAQLANNMPNQVNNNLPMQLDKADFQPNIPHHYGQCLPDQNPSIQINLQFSGANTALLDLKVMPVSNTYADYGTYYAFSDIPVNAKHSKHINFSFPLINLLSQDKYSYMAISDNKVWNHNMKIVARVKPEGGEWSQWQDYDTAVFKHRCEPQVKFHSPAGMGGYQNNGEGAPVVPGRNTVKPADIKPDMGKIQAPAPVDPTPVPGPRRVQPADTDPQPQLQLKAIPQE